MAKEHFFVIGGGELQVKFIKAVKNRGYFVHVFDYNPDCPGKQEADCFHLISIDDVKGIYNKALIFNPVAIQTVATELGNITACTVGEKLGLRNNSGETALNTTDKSRMKKILNAHGIRNAKTVVLHDGERVPISSISFPCVVKASDRSASRGITFVTNENEFETAYRDAYNESFNKVVLIEEYLPGQQYSVETVSSNGNHFIVAVTEENTDGIPNFVETCHLMPARINIVEYENLEKFIFIILDAFGIKYGACHVELKCHNGEWSVIELASRMGGWRDEMAELSMGIDYLQLIIDAATGTRLDVLPRFKSFAIFRTILNHKDWKSYLSIKQEYPGNIFYESIHYDGEECFQAKTLMESKGWYYFVTDDVKLVNYFMRNCQ